MKGVRWAMDWGADSYGLKDYWDKTKEGRYRWYRKSTAGHNTLSLNCNVSSGQAAGYSPCDQSPKGIAAISVFNSTSFGAVDNFAVLNLTDAYGGTTAPAPTKVHRGFAFTQGFGQLLIVDELQYAASHAKNKGKVTWSMHTEAFVSLDPRAPNKAVLQKDGLYLIATVMEPHMIRFTKENVTLMPPQAPVKTAVTKLMLELDSATSLAGSDGLLSDGLLRIVVGFSFTVASPTLEINALSEWATMGPLG